MKIYKVMAEKGENFFMRWEVGLFLTREKAEKRLESLRDADNNSETSYSIVETEVQE